MRNSCNNKKQNYSLQSSASVTLLFALAAPIPLFAQVAPVTETTMPTVVVKDTAETQSQGYQSSVTNVGKFQQAAKDIPQSLTTVTRGLMDDRNADSLKDALRNVAGLTFNAGEGGRIGDNITIRGFAASSDLYLDGMRDNAQYNRDIFNQERIEVLRGASSMIFGRGSTGGIVNQASKEPELNKKSEVEVTYGSYNYKRTEADINKKISDTSAIRINAMYTDTDSFRDEVSQTRWGIAPELRWGIGTNDEFLLGYYHLQYDDIPDYGIPIQPVNGGKPIRTDLSNFYGLASVDYQKDSANIYTGRWIHKFDNGMKLKTMVRKNDVNRDLRAVAPRVNAGITSVTRGRQARGAEENNFTASSDLTSKFEILGMKHEGLVGTEFVREVADRWSYFSSAPTNNPIADPFNPNPFDPLPSGYSATYQHINPLDFTARNLGFYGQDIVEFIPHWKGLIGGRFDDFNADYSNTTTSSGLVTAYDRNDKVFSWRTGLMYQPTDYVTYYIAYGTAFNPSGDIYSVEATQAARAEKTDPEKSINYEIGVKWELMNGDLSLRTALFRTEKTNERNTDPAQADIYLLSGQRHTDGVEFEAAGRINSEWEVFGALALMTAEIDKHINPHAVGLTPVNTPGFSGNVWTTYKVAPKWKIGGGMDFVGERKAYSIGTTTPYTAPVIRHISGYARFDAMVEWQMLDNTSLKLNLFNLTNQRYFDSIYPNGGHAILGQDRSAQLSLSYKF